MEYLEILLDLLTEEEIKNLILNIEGISEIIYFTANGPIEKLLFRLNEEIEKGKQNSIERKNKLDDDLIYTVLPEEVIEKLQIRIKSKTNIKPQEEVYYAKLLYDLNEEKNKRSEIIRKFKF